MQDRVLPITVTEEDLNDIDALNGNGAVSQRDEVNIALKGALGIAKQQINVYNEWVYIQNLRKQMYRFLVGRFRYENLPLGLTKNRIERKILSNGQVGILNYLGDYLAVNVVVNSVDIYGEPFDVTINEPKSSLNGKKYKNGIDIAVIRNNEDRDVEFTQAQRHIVAMERILFQLEKNPMVSAPKGLINLKNTEFDEPNNSAYKDAMERMINGEDTFFALRTNEEYDPTKSNEDEIFIPIELTDRADSLIKQYEFQKSLLKEIIGASLTTTNDKKERLVNVEVENQQDFSDSAVKHAFEIREDDIERFNELFGEDMQIFLDETFNEEVVNDNENGGGEDE